MDHGTSVPCGQVPLFERLVGHGTMGIDGCWAPWCLFCWLSFGGRSGVTSVNAWCRVLPVDKAAAPSDDQARLDSLVGQGRGSSWLRSCGGRLVRDLDDDTLVSWSRSRVHDNLLADGWSVDE